MKRWVFPAVSVVMGIALMCGVAELSLAILNPKPRVQLLHRDKLVSLEHRRGRVVWRQKSPIIERLGCAGAGPDVARVAFVGSSIFRGSGVPGDTTFSSLLQRSYADGRTCIDNVAEPGFTSEQKHVVAMDLLEAAEAPDLLYMEVWQNDIGAWVQVGDWAVNALQLRTDASGVPNPAGLPEAWNVHALQWSHLYRYLALAAVSTDRSPVELWQPMWARDLEPVLDLAKARGTEVVLVVAPPLNRPFSETLGREFQGYEHLAQIREARGLDRIDIARWLIDEDPVAMRVDPCCHYSKAGHERLASAFRGDIERRLRPSTEAP